MVTLEQAKHIAANYLVNLQGQIGIPIQIVKVLNTKYGWVFFYNSSEYVKFGNIGAMLAGNAPFLIDSKDGAINVFGTAQPLEIYLQEYERSRGGS